MDQNEKKIFFEKNRFKTERYNDVFIGDSCETYVLTDKVTGKEYIAIRDSRNSNISLTPLQS
jgi:hypothetical protein